METVLSISDSSMTHTKEATVPLERNHLQSFVASKSKYVVVSSMYRDRVKDPSPLDFECLTATQQDTIIDGHTIPILQVDTTTDPYTVSGSTYVFSINGIILSYSIDTIIVQVAVDVPSRIQYLIEYNNTIVKILGERKLSTYIWEFRVDPALQIDLFISSTVIIRSGYMNVASQVFVPYSERNVRLFKPNVPNSYFVGYSLIDTVTGVVYKIVSYDSYTSTITLTPPNISSPILSYIIVQHPSAFPIVNISTVVSNTVTFTPTLDTVPYIYKLYSYNINTRTLTQVELTSTSTFTYSSGTFTVGDNIYLAPVRSASYPLTGPTRTISPITCKQVECLGIYIPNAPIASSRGGTLNTYPYIVIELSQPQQSNLPTNVFQQNIPFYQTFICPMRDIAPNEDSAFIRLDGGMTRHTMVFYENQSIRVRIRTPDNEIIKYTRQDTPYPCPPDPYGQVTLVLSVTYT